MSVPAWQGPEFDGAAACAEADPEAWFPQKGGGSVESTARAKAICRGCEVLDDCLIWALDNAEAFGVWGGTTPSERRRLLARERGRVA